MAKKPTAKQLAWRKKFARMAKNGKFTKKPKRKARVSGTTTMRIPSNKKSRTVNVKRGKRGQFEHIGSISVLKNGMMKKLETDYANKQVKLLKATGKRNKNKIRKEITSIKSSMRRVEKL